MIKHIVMWKFKENEEENMKKFLDGLLSLKGQIEVIKKLEVGVNTNPANNFDAVLVTEFETMEDLESYQKDPRHVKVASLCKEIRIAREAIDYEC